VKRYEPGKEVAPGITSIAAYGHTWGSTAFAVASDNQSMLVLSDASNHPSLFVRNPEWQAIFDMDGAIAADNRKQLHDRTAAVVIGSLPPMCGERRTFTSSTAWRRPPPVRRRVSRRPGLSHSP
jgi:glyoxylase-like metal-dependent hydrolase (beta-lactamase superfamily II)